MSSTNFTLVSIIIVVITCSLCGANSGFTMISQDDSSGFIRSDAIPGGELDYFFTENGNDSKTFTLVWDGCDSAPDKLDHSGLGGINLETSSRIDKISPRYQSQVDLWDDQGREISEFNLKNVGSIAITLSNIPADTPLINLLQMGSELFSLQAKNSTNNRTLVPADLIVQIGDTPTGGGGNAVVSLNNPFTNGNGVVGFTGAVDNGGANDHFVWYDTGIVWLNSAAVGETLTGSEATMGISDQGAFIYSPAVNGFDSVYTNFGLLLSKGDQAPGHPAGTNNTFNSRPTLLPDGTALWIAGFDDTGGTSTKGRMLYKCPNPAAPTFTIIIQSDDLIDGIPVDRPSGVGFDYMVSDLNDHYIQEILLDTGSSSDDGIVYVDGATVAREGQPAPGGANWDNFDRMVINNSGNYAFSGDTDANTDVDEFICFNGAMVIQEGDTIAGVELVAGSSLGVMSLNNDNVLVHQWSVGGVDTLFLTCDLDNADTTTHLILAAGDTVDFDGDMIADATVTDLKASGSISFGYWLAEDGFLFAEVDLDFGSGDVEAIIRLPLPECGPGPCVNHGDVTLDGFLTAGDAQLAFLIALGSHSPSFEEECAADCNGDHSVTAGDAQQIFLAVMGSSSCEDPI